MIRRSENSMFFKSRVDAKSHGPAAEVLQILRAAGCNTASENDLQLGMISFNTALLACKWRHTNKPAGRPTTASRVGRNEPCPCGSGRKYKKCCLDKDRSTPADDLSLAPLEFGPETLPRMWDERAIAEDCSLLGQIMDRDPELESIGFSSLKVASFMEAVADDDPSLMDDSEELERTLDDLAIRYARESGEGTIVKGMKNKLLAACVRAQSKDEVRALATGICMALMSDASGDPDDNLLNIILFRKALRGAIRSATLIDEVVERLGGDSEELRRALATNDPAAHQKVQSCIDHLTGSDLEALEDSFEQGREELWNTISSGEFPVPLPFATQLALFYRMVFFDGNSGERSAEAMYETIKAFSEELIEEDYVVYGQMVDRWLKDSTKQAGHVRNAVKLMAGLCAIRSIEDFVPGLFVRGKGSFVPFDKDEQRFIESDPERYDHPEFIAGYSAWLASKGYPGMASRLLEFRAGQANDESPDRFEPRKLSVG
jgi:hypothetical protein